MVELLNAKDFVCSINILMSSIGIDYTKRELLQPIIDAINLDLYHTKKIKIPDISMNEKIIFSLITSNNQFEDEICQIKEKIEITSNEMATVNIINGENGLRGNLINNILRQSSLIIIALSEQYVKEYQNNDYN